MNILYFDPYDFGDSFPYVMIKALCANPGN